MAYTLSNLLIDTLVRLGRLKASIATGGSTSTAIDTSIIGLDNDDDWKNGYLFVLSTTDGLAPIGEFKKISGYVSTTGTFSTSTFSASIGSGDRFGYSAPYEFPIDTMISLANLALSSLGDIALVDTTTVTVAGQTEYTHAIAWKRRKPYRLDIQTNSTSGDYRWEQINFEYIPAAPGSTGLLVLDTDYDAGKYLRVWYDGVHPELTAYNSAISETIPPELIRSMMYEKVLEWKNNELGGTNAFMLRVWEKAQQDLNMARATHKIYKPHRDNNHVKLGRF
jgi:hypothetical protein